VSPSPLAWTCDPLFLGIFHVGFPSDRLRRVHIGRGPTRYYEVAVAPSPSLDRRSASKAKGVADVIDPTLYLSASTRPPKHASPMA